MKVRLSRGPWSAFMYETYVLKVNNDLSVITNSKFLIFKVVDPSFVLMDPDILFQYCFKGCGLCLDINKIGMEEFINKIVESINLDSNYLYPCIYPYVFNKYSLFINSIVRNSI